MNIHDTLNDLSGRFLLNLLPMEMNNPERLMFHVEEAHWFYEDYYKRKHNLPSMTLKTFSVYILKHIGYPAGNLKLQEDYKRFIKYKKSVPVFGGVIFNSRMTKILMVQGYGKYQTYTFPRGKISRGENELECALREVNEEIGYSAEKKMLKSVCIDLSTNSKESKLFAVLNVPEHTKFETQTRGEIKSISWVSLSSIEREDSPILAHVKTYIKEIKTLVRKINQTKVPLNKESLKKAFGIVE
ncbi:mRNA-decapping enzyme subunit 2 [Nematocida sp. AWRm77]|nr:mRNA-decapping enzyme subunit 2 [Nematocida sp. AWRm77]